MDLKPGLRARAPLRILALHSAYRTLGGEDQSFQEEVSLFTSMGHTVETIVVENADFGAGDVVKLGFIENKSITQQVESGRYDLLYLNNLWPSIGPGVARRAAKRGIPILQAIRNYRLICAAATLQREGHTCTDCIAARSRLPGVRHGCYQGSSAMSAAVSLAARTNTRLIDANAHWKLLSTSQFTADRLIQYGFSEDQILVRPNFLHEAPVPSLAPGSGAIFAARLSREKGALWLAQLWRSHPELPHLTMCGEGPLRDEIAATIHGVQNATLLPAMPRDKVLDLMRQSAVTLVPSLWDEPFGRTVIESMAVGTPAIVSRRGALPFVAGSAGARLDTSAPKSWAGTISTISREQTATDRQFNVDRFNSHFSRTAAIAQMSDIISSLFPNAQAGHF